ncbi:MAG: prolyl oligopeptidase family serine peptidase [Deltaproteobacteria bacterium]|nr:prolyl oligopeptidase family serine peptidase [Deltaproteobacteria bacterium]
MKRLNIFLKVKRLPISRAVLWICLLALWSLPFVSRSASGTAQSGDTATPKASGQSISSDELLLSPGSGGFLSTWLKLGPIHAPKYVTAKEGALKDWHPAATDNKEVFRFGAWMAGKQVDVLTENGTRIGLKPLTGTVTYLAAVVRSQREQQIYLSSASTDGIQVFLNGQQLLSNSSHKRWIRRDVNLTSLPLNAGENLLVIKLFKEKPGRWSTYLRFMDKDFQRAPITVSLPNAAEKRTEVLQEAARIVLQRHVQTHPGNFSMDCWLEFKGAKPLLSHLDSWSLTIKGVDGINTTAATAPLTNTLHPQKSKYLLQRFNGAGEIPEQVQLQFNGATWQAFGRIRPAQLETLLAVSHRFFSTNLSQFPSSTTESMEWRISYLASLFKQGDTGFDYISRELADTEKMVAAMEKGEDPYAGKRNQLQRRGYRSQVDGALHHYALYVPPGWKEDGDQLYSMIVALHGLGGHPVKTISTLFGNPMGEDETREQRVRNPGSIGRAPMFVVAPEGFGNSGYYALGERDVIDVINIVKERYRIDEKRIYITGASMGGIGAARIPLHYPDLFAAAVPLCGYHNMRYYSQVRQQPLSPVEDYLLDVHSNIRWVENGAHIPMHIVHGTKDQPRQSQDLLEHYKLQGNDATLTLLDAGHNVWDDTYKNGWIFRHFMRYHRNPHPRNVQFKTASLRYSQSAWLRIDDRDNPNTWAQIDGQWPEDGHIRINTQNIDAFTVERDEKLAATLFQLDIDNDHFPPDVLTSKENTFVRHDGHWRPEAFTPSPHTKTAGLSGPIGDAEYDSLLFVYGTKDKWEGTLAKRIIGHLKTPRYGMTVKWKVKADVEVTPEDIERYSIVIVGTRAGNALLKRMADKLPIQVKDGAIHMGKKTFNAKRTAASFIYPNPLNPKRYVVVHTGNSREAIFFTAHLPNMIPDYVIYDASDWGYTEGYVLSEDRQVLASGFFDKNWQLISPQ